MLKLFSRFKVFLNFQYFPYRLEKSIEELPIQNVFFNNEAKWDFWTKKANIFQTNKIIEKKKLCFNANQRIYWLYNYHTIDMYVYLFIQNYNNNFAKLGVITNIELLRVNK